MLRARRNVRGRVGPWSREHMRPWVGSPTRVDRERDARDGRLAARPPRGRGMGRGPSRRGVPAPSCPRSVRGFSCALGGSGEAWRRGGLERCATARLRSLLSCDAHCVCVPGAGLRTARTGQQGLAGLAEARLQSCFRLKNA